MSTEEQLRLPENLREKTATFPESSMGANRVKLELKDGRRNYNVSLAWGETIVKIGNRHIQSADELDFRIADITDVTSDV
jgi:hypothetical protein